ncbi:MAG: dNTP triphosphohydrolase [Oscillibacter sp.]|nr:dNTP triphosphohydrolase [Oscillibacter sp.]
MKQYAAQNTNPLLTRRLLPEREEAGPCRREPYQRDRDRILHARAFRRMMHKTQIFNANFGDHYRNRLTHTLEVSQIARSLGKALGLNDELVEAVALGHDLGHTPFGHMGERTLHRILSQGLPPDVPALGEGFKHNLQSLRVVDQLETRCEEYTGINLTLAVREGILKHTKLAYKEEKAPLYPETDFDGMDLTGPSCTLEGQAVAVADEIAQCTHDLEDGVRSKIIPFSEILGRPLVRRVVNKYGISLAGDANAFGYDARTRVIQNLVGFLIEDVCLESRRRITDYVSRHSLDGSGFREICVAFSPAVEPLVRDMLDHIRRRLICSEQISVADAKAERIITTLFRTVYLYPKQLPDYVLQRYCRQQTIAFDRLELSDHALQSDPVFLRAISDYIAGMSDQYAAREFMRLTMPEYL